MNKFLRIILIFAYMNCYAQDFFQVRLEGQSQLPVDGQKIDREEAITDAMNKVDRKLNFNIILMLEREEYTIIDKGYDKDSLYHIILQGDAALIGGNSQYIRITGEKSPVKNVLRIDHALAFQNAKQKGMNIDTLDIEEMIDSKYYIVSPVGYINDSTYQLILEGWAARVDPAEFSDYAKGVAIILAVLAAAAVAVIVYFVLTYEK